MSGTNRLAPHRNWIGQHQGEPGRPNNRKLDQQAVQNWVELGGVSGQSLPQYSDTKSENAMTTLSKLAITEVLCNNGHIYKFKFFGKKLNFASYLAETTNNLAAYPLETHLGLKRCSPPPKKLQNIIHTCTGRLLYYLSESL